MTAWLRTMKVLGCATALIAGNAHAADVIKIAIIAPLSGAFASIGEGAQRGTQLAIDQINAHGGVPGGKTFELVALDGQVSPQDSILALKKAIDQGIR